MDNLELTEVNRIIQNNERVDTDFIRKITGYSTCKIQRIANALRNLNLIKVEVVGNKVYYVKW